MMRVVASFQFCRISRVRSWPIVVTGIRRECNAPVDYLEKMGARSSFVDVCVLEEPPLDAETCVTRDSLLAR